MLIFDELKKNDPQLRLLAVAMAAGLGILLAGLWWVQVVSAPEYRSHLETQGLPHRAAPRHARKKFWIAKAACWPRTGRVTI